MKQPSFAICNGVNLCQENVTNIHDIADTINSHDTRLIAEVYRALRQTS